MSETPLVWLTAILDEDERVARAATEGPWRWSPNKHWRKPDTSWFEEAVFAGQAGADATCVAGTGETDDPQSMADAEHIARHDPATVLADIAAKRGILATCKDYLHEYESGVDPCASIVLDYLASAYAHRPGYLAEWSPE